MNAEHLLDAMGLLDDDLIQEAEAYTRKKPRYGVWVSWAACFAVVLALGYALIHLGLDSVNSSIGSTGAASPFAPAENGGGDWEPAGGDQAPAAEEQETSSAQLDAEAPGGSGSALETLPGSSPDALPNGDYCAAIMVDGILYWSTGQALPIEVAESAVRTVTSYINTVPQMDGQTNFSQDLSARYAQTSEGLVVLMDSEWVLFVPDLPQGG